MNKNDKHYYKVKKNVNLPEGADGIIYRVWWMVLVNLLLKIIQPFTKDPFLVNVVSTEDDYGDPHFDGYAFKRTHCSDGYFERIKASLFSGRYADKFYKEENEKHRTTAREGAVRTQEKGPRQAEKETAESVRR